MKFPIPFLALFLVECASLIIATASNENLDVGNFSNTKHTSKHDLHLNLPELPGIKINIAEWCVDIDAYTCLKEGVLELIACTKGSKEHESIVAIESTAKNIHTALLLLGAKAGSPAKRQQVGGEGTTWVDIPPKGTPIDVFIVYEDQETGMPNEKPINEFITQEDGETFSTNTFLFAGSILHTEANTGVNHYLADRNGNVISISTFGDELLCLPGFHSQVNTELYWNADGDKLPEIGTRVTLRLRPQTAPTHQTNQTKEPASADLNSISKKTMGPGPTKVFILAGQSNMEGQGVVSMNHPKYYNGGKGNLEWSMIHSKSADKMKHLKDEQGNWTIREDVQISFKSKGKQRKGNLTIGYTGYGGNSHIGPELQFGHVIGDYFDEPVLLIKTAWGGKSLYEDFRPPSSGGQIGEYYTKLIEEVHAALEELKNDRYELAGFVWMQGWNDMITKHAIPAYAENLSNLAKDIREELNAPQLPFIVGELGNGGPVDSDGNMARFRKAQRIGTARITNAKFVETTNFAHSKELSPNITHGHHWFGNAESYFQIGEALAKAAIELIEK